MTQEALKLALEALERSDCLGYQANLKAITAIKEALLAKPAQRTWVGLTDEEIKEAWFWGGVDPPIEGAHFTVLYQYFEDKLRKKNT